jgi:hypothetical protein
MSASNLSDESLLRYYDSIRKQVEADRGNKHKFMTSDSVKQYAESLRLELYKRRLLHTPIDWWTDQETDAVTPSKSDASDRRAEPVEETTAEPAEATTIDVHDPVEQLDDLKNRIDALIKGPGSN